MRSVAPRDSSTSLPQLSQTRMVFRAIPSSLRICEREVNSGRKSESGTRLVLAVVQLKTIVILEGDQTGQELLEESLRVLSPDVIGLEIDLPRFDLSLESRRATQNAI